jgi:two-component system cell cycle response regulator
MMAARILIIEDNQPNMDLLTYLLTAFGHVPLQAGDGEQGVAMARRELPDLILCDLHLPRLDGYGVLAQLRADPATRQIPILAASALPVNDNCAALRRAGFTGCLPKSLEPTQLMEVLETFLAPAHRSGTQADTAATPNHNARQAPPSGPARAHVLLLDAAPENAGLVASILHHSGYRVAVAGNIGEVASAASMAFDLVLCDLGLFDGGRTTFLADALRQLPQHAPVIVIRPDHDDDVSALSAGRPRPLQMLSHPLDPQLLMAAIESSLAG